MLAQAAVGVSEIADLSGLQARRVDDVRELEAGGIAGARAVALFTIGETPWSDGQRAPPLEGLRSGRLALLAIHSATDSCYGWADYGRLVGARFDGHPWTQDVERGRPLLQGGSSPTVPWPSWSWATSRSA